MKTLEYYFTQEFQWNKEWFSLDGISKAIVYPSNEFIKTYEYVDYTIIGNIFMYKANLNKIENVESVIDNIESVIAKNKLSYVVFSEMISLEINAEYTRPIDNIGTKDGQEGPLSWNTSTPENLQFVPTPEILNLFIDWKNFLKETHVMKYIRHI
jgi:hypothetical protein